MKPRFEPAPLDVPVVDVWPPGRLNAAARWAYREAQAAGRIRLEREFVDPANGCTVIRYLADIPVEWIHAELGDRKRRWNGEQLNMKAQFEKEQEE